MNRPPQPPPSSRLLHRLLVLCLPFLAQALPAAPALPAKPNIIVILVDDMGFSDLGCYGSEIPTPNLDKLAANGVRFTQFYNTGRCCPTRAALLTGLYSHQAGVGHMMTATNAPGYQGHLNDRCATLAEVLKPAGYFTAMTGKWHVGMTNGANPWLRGFERSLNAPAGGFYQSDSPKAVLFLNGEKIAKDDARLPKDWYSTDLWTTFGLKFIDEALAEKKPFFLYLAHNAPHFPLQAPDAEIAQFRGKYLAGWDAIAQARYQRQLELGIIDKAWPKAPRANGIPDWESLSKAEKERFDRLMAVYAAVVHHMDKAVGDLVQGLSERGVLDNTLILFMSDNGGNAEGGVHGTSNGDPSEAKSTWFCGKGWAFVENTPFRLFKHFNHEGGIATPLIVHWPAAFKALEQDGGANRRGQLCREPAHLIDIMATCADVAGATYPKELKGKPVTPMEGVSLRPALSGAPLTTAPRALFWEHEGNAAVRVGDWKLVRQGRNGKWELHNMKEDRTELKDLASAQPDKAKDLAAQWEAWAERAQVKPYPKGKVGAEGAVPE